MFSSPSQTCPEAGVGSSVAPMRGLALALCGACAEWPPLDQWTASAVDRIEHWEHSVYSAYRNGTRSKSGRWAAHAERR